MHQAEHCSTVFVQLVAGLFGNQECVNSCNFMQLEVMVGRYIIISCLLNGIIVHILGCPKSVMQHAAKVLHEVKKCFVHATCCTWSYQWAFTNSLGVTMLGLALFWHTFSFFQFSDVSESVSGAKSYAFNWNQLFSWRTLRMRHATVLQRLWNENLPANEMRRFDWLTNCWHFIAGGSASH